MRPVLFEIPGLGLKIFGFASMLVLGFLGGIGLAAWRSRREKLDPEVIYDLVVWLFVGGLVGARLFFVVQHREAIHTAWDIFKIWRGGIVFYGSVIGGVAAFLLFWSRQRFPLRPTLDAIAPSVALGMVLGRLGCFLNGCCFGDACDLPWAVRFPAESLPWADQVESGQIPVTATHSLPVHPTQLYSALDGLILLALLSAYYPLRRRDGEVMALLMVAYPITRFLIERLRNDEAVFFAGMTISQNLSILLFLVGVVFWLGLSRLPAGRYADSFPGARAAQPSGNAGAIRNP